MNSLKGLILFCLTLTIMSSCDEEEGPVTLFSKSWRPSLTDQNPTATLPLPPFMSNPAVYKNWETCEQVDTFKFHKNGSLVITHKGTACDGESTSTTTVPFTYDAESGDLIIDGVTFKLHEVSAKQLKYYTTLSQASGFGAYIFLFK